MNIRAVQWNVGRGHLGEAGFMGQDGNVPQTDRICSFLASLKPDVIFLQESFDAKTNTMIGAAVAERLDMYVLEQIYAGVQEGMAIVSRWPMDKTHFSLLPNPNLSIDKGEQGMWRTFDKGMLSAIVQAPTYSFRARTMHMFPVHHFNAAITDDQFAMLRDEVRFRLAGEDPEENVLVGADLNVDNAVEVFGLHNMQNCVTGITNPKYNNQTDYVLASSNFNVTGAQIIEEGKDHHCLVVDFEQQPI